MTLDTCQATIGITGQIDIGALTIFSLEKEFSKKMYWKQVKT